MERLDGVALGEGGRTSVSAGQAVSMVSVPRSSCSAASVTARPYFLEGGALGDHQRAVVLGGLEPDPAGRRCEPRVRVAQRASAQSTLAIRIASAMSSGSAFR